MLVKPLVLNGQETFESALRQLDEGGIGMLPVVDMQGRLQGIITDGDLRRALLRGNPSLEGIVNKAPHTVPATMLRHEVLQKLRQLRLRHMPVIDEAGTLVDFVFLDNLIAEPHNNTVVIMAGGMGTRLGSLTADTPKPMLPVGGRPILERIMERFADQGFKKFVLCVNYKAEKIKDYFGEGSRFGWEVQYTTEQKRMGTAGALTLVPSSMLREPFFVTNGDVLANCDYLGFLDSHIKSGAAASMCVKKYEYQIPYACITSESDNSILDIREKPTEVHWINAGVYMLSPESVAFIPKDEFYDMPTLFQSLALSQKRCMTYRMDDYWIDIGNPVDYERADGDHKN